MFGCADHRSLWVYVQRGVGRKMMQSKMFADPDPNPSSSNSPTAANVIFNSKDCFNLWGAWTLRYIEILNS